MIIDVEGLCKVFKPSRRITIHALKDVTLHVEKGEAVGVIGPNASGKSTLLKILAGVLAPTSGRALINGYDVYRERDSIRASTSIVTDNPFSGLIEYLNVKENLVYYARLCGLNSRGVEERVESVVELLGLKNVKDKLFLELSGGEKQKVYVAKALMVRTPIMLFDEALAHIDFSTRNMLKDYIKFASVKYGQTLVFASHDLYDVADVCERIFILHNGRILFSGSLNELMNKAKLENYEKVELELFGYNASIDAMLSSISGVVGVKVKIIDPSIGHAKIRILTDSQGLSIYKVFKSLSSFKLISFVNAKPDFIDAYIKFMEDVRHERG